MIEVNQKVVSTIEKIRKYVEATGANKEEFPMESVNSLIEATIGESFWRCLCSKQSDVYRIVPQLYKEGFERALEKKDTESCVYLLTLFEYNYRSLMTALGDEERYARERPYKKQIIEIGEAYSKLQYRLHKERQKDLPQIGVKLNQGKGVVYTCALKDEMLFQPDDLDAQMEYICFTDDSSKWGEKEGAWNYRELEVIPELQTEQLRTRCRMLPHHFLPEYDYSIWLDRNFKVVGDINLFCDVYGNGNSFLGFSQTSRDCMYKDMLVADMGSDERNIEIRKQIYSFKEEGYQEHYGLVDNRIMVRNHREPRLRKVMEDCLHMILEEDKKNILATYFNYIAWKNDFPFSICDLFIYNNPYFFNMEVDLETHEKL